MTRRWAFLPVFALTCLAPSAASAFLVVGKQKTPPSTDRMTVVALREGGRQVLSLVPHLTDKSGEIAVVVPVANPSDTRTLSPSAFAALARVSGPRVVELWEADPCKIHPAVEPGPLPPDGSAAPSASASAAPSSAASAAPSAAAPSSAAPATSSSSAPAKPAATDAGASYSFEILDGKDALAKLKDEGYTVPDAATPILSSYADAGMKVVIAKIDASKIDALPPLSMLTTSSELSLPTRLFAAGAGHGSLEIFVVSPQNRYEAKDQENLAIPTNLDFAGASRPKLDGFYASLLDHAFEKKPNALVTEYAWRASTCDDCEAPPAPSMITDLGVALLPSMKEGTQAEVLSNAEGVSSEPGGPDALQAGLKSCYAKSVAEKPTLSGSLRFEVEVANGAVTGVKPASDPGSAAGESALVECMTTAIKASHLDKSGALALELSPFSRKYFGDLVVTKLRARFGAIPDKDLVLKPARAIEGGRERGPSGTAEKKVYWSEGGNDFQARYVVRHTWKGAIACDSPERGVWSPKPPKGAKPSEPKPAASLGASLEGGVPSLDAFVIPASDPIPPPPSPSPDASSSGAPPAPPPPSASAAPAPSALPPPQGGGCGCVLAQEEPTSSGALALTLVGAALAARKRRARRDR